MSARDLKPDERGDEILFFGAQLHRALERARVPGDAAAHAVPPAVRPRIPYHGGYPLRGRWLLADYTGLRNAAWSVRNSRVGADLNPLALKLVLAEAERLVAGGESLADVLEAFAELLSKP